MLTALSDCLNSAYAIWLRDIRSEFRTRYAINVILTFAITVLIAVSFSIGAFRIEPAEKPFLFSVLLWIVLLFSALSGLPHSFMRERDTKTMDLLKLSSRPHAVFLGKLFFNMTLMAALEIIVTPLFILFMGYHIDRPLYFAITIMLGGWGLSSGTTLIAALVAMTNARSALFATLSIPITLPMMIIAIKGCEHAALGNSGYWAEVMKLETAYCIIMTTISILLFPKIWES